MIFRKRVDWITKYHIIKEQSSQCELKFKLENILMKTNFSFHKKIIRTNIFALLEQF